MARGVPTKRAHGLTLASCLMCVHTKKATVITAEGGFTFYFSSKVGDLSHKLAGHSPHDCDTENDINHTRTDLDDVVERAALLCYMGP